MRYAFAVTVSILAVLIEVFVDRFTDQPIYPFLPGFAAIIASAAWAGVGPGVASTVLLVGWSVSDLHASGRTLPNILIRCGMLLAEGLLLSLGSARMLRLARNSARSEAWHRLLFDTASEGIWICDNSGAITWANARMAGLLGTTVEEMIGSHGTDFVFLEDRAVERIRLLMSKEGLNFDEALEATRSNNVFTTHTPVPAGIDLFDRA